MAKTISVFTIDKIISITFYPQRTSTMKVPDFDAKLKFWQRPYPNKDVTREIPSQCVVKLVDEHDFVFEVTEGDFNNMLEDYKNAVSEKKILIIYTEK